MQTLILSDATGFFAGGVGLLFLIALVLVSIFWLWMLIDCLTSSMPSTEKLIWFLVIFFLHILGAVLYYVIQRGGGNRHAMS
jgi:ABC-type multidrug transport system fused ATPase/permease subunit